MRDARGYEIVGPDPWPARLRSGLPRHSSVPVGIVVTPQPRARAIVSELRICAKVIIYATDPSVAEAAVLAAVGAVAYVSEVDDLAAAVRSVTVGGAWFSPVAAAAVCRLARMTRDPAFDALAAAARATAAGRSWSVACLSVGVPDSARQLERLVQSL